MNEIPEGNYCYSFKIIDNVEIKVVCPHWSKTDNGAYCSFLKEEHFEYCGYHLVWDQVKCCNQNMQRHGMLHEPENGTELMYEICECGKNVKYWNIR